MDKETLFKEIRQGRALLWVGAGLSRYAGYPMGAEVVRRLYDELSTAQRQELAIQEGQETPECPKWPLPKFAQHFIDLHHGNRTRLIEILDQIFSAEPSTMHVHEKLARIAHINHIVTTNYDPLFELAYRPARLHVVGRASQIPQIGNKDVTLYKIHGQPSMPESVIISEEDYNGFFNSADDIVWTYLRGLMSTKTIAFIGYAVEDPNVLSVFDDLIKKLGKLMKPAYVVGPTMDKIRQERLLRNNIHYIKATGEEFIDELWDYIQATALTELHKDGLSAVAPTGQMLKNLGLDFTVKVDGSGPLIAGVKRMDGPTKSEFIFTSDSKALQKSLEDMNSGRSLKVVKIELPKLLQYSHTVEGFKMPTGDISAIWLARAPNWEGIIDIRINSKLLISGVAVWTYNGNDVVHIVALSSVSRIEVSVHKPTEDGPEFTISAQSRSKYYRNLASARENAQLLMALAEGQSIEIFLKGKLIWHNTEYPWPANADVARNAKLSLSIIDALEVVERNYGIIFQHFSLSENNFNDLSELIAVLQGQPVHGNPAEHEEYIGKFVNPTIEELAVLANKKRGKKISVGIRSVVTGKYDVLGWVFQVSWHQNFHLLQPIFRKMPDGTYGVKSKARRSVTEYVKVYDKIVVQALVAKQPVPLTFEETLQERLPQEE